MRVMSAFSRSQHLFPAVCLALLPLWGLPAAATAGEVSISGEGKIQYKPDQVRLQLTARAEEPSVEQATESVEQAVQQWEKAITAYEAQFDEYDSASLNLYTRRPDPGPENKAREPVTIASQTISFLLTDLGSLNSVLQAAQASGMEYNLNDGNFSHTNEDQLSQQALGLAIDDARRQCQFIANRLGRKCGEIKTISTGSGGRPMPLMMADARGSSSGPVTAVGPREITVNVNATFAIE